MRKVTVSILLLAPLLVSCGLVERGTHNAGKNCMWPGCHGYEAPTWTYAGTVFTSADRSSGAQGVTVIIRDRTGEIKLSSDSVGNFYTAEGDPSAGYRASVSNGHDTQRMSIEPASGACNSCHTPDGEVAPLRLANQ